MPVKQQAAFELAKFDESSKKQFKLYLLLLFLSEKPNPLV